MRTMQTLPGDHIRDCCKKALDMAVSEHETVQFAFNDKIIIAKPDSTLDELYVQWGYPVLTAEEDRKRNADELERMKREQAEGIASAGAATEAEMRAAKGPWPRSLEELTNYIKTLTERPHDYGTCCYAMSLAAVAAFNFVGHHLVTTGFQAGFAQMDFLRRQCGLECGFQILNYENLLYPQYEFHFHITPEGLLAKSDVRKVIVEAAKKKLALHGKSAHPHVVAHWEKLAALPVSPERVDALTT